MFTSLKNKRFVHLLISSRAVWVSQTMTSLKGFPLAVFYVRMEAFTHKFCKTIIQLVYNKFYKFQWILSSQLCKYYWLSSLKRCLILSLTFQIKQMSAFCESKLIWKLNRSQRRSHNGSWFTAKTKIEFMYKKKPSVKTSCLENWTSWFITPTSHSSGRWSSVVQKHIIVKDTRVRDESLLRWRGTSLQTWWPGVRIELLINVDFCRFCFSCLHFFGKRSRGYVSVWCNSDHVDSKRCAHYNDMIIMGCCQSSISLRFVSMKILDDFIM